MSPHTAPSTLSVRVLQGADELAAIEPAWWSLWRRCPEATPFESPAWLLPWWEHFGSSGLAALAAMEGDLLRGLWPLMASDDAAGGRTLRPIGVGITDRLDALVEPGAGSRVASAMAAVLGRREDWGTLDLQQVPHGSPLLDLSFAGCRVTQVLQDVSPVLKLTRPLPPAVARRLAYERRRAARTGLTIQTADRNTIDGWIQALVELHAARWSARGEGGVLSDPLVQSFHRDAARRMLEAGLLRMYGVRAEGRAAACLYAFTGRQRCCFYLGGFDPSMARLSPGVLLIGHAIEQAAAEGVAEFDFLRGGEGYKYRWGAEDRPQWRRRVVRLRGGER